MRRREGWEEGKAKGGGGEQGDVNCSEGARVSERQRRVDGDEERVGEGSVNRGRAARTGTSGPRAITSPDV